MPGADLSDESLTVRVLPRHEGMVSPIEMGLVAAPAPLGAPAEPVLR